MGSRRAVGRRAHVPTDAARLSTRRLLILAAAAWPALAWAGAAVGQSKRPAAVIGWLTSTSLAENGPALAAIKEELATLGWDEGTNYIVDERWADGQRDRLPALAAELTARTPALIIATPLPAVQAAAKASTNIPIVQAGGLAGGRGAREKPGAARRDGHRDHHHCKRGIREVP